MATNTQPSALASLVGKKYISLTTFRKTGAAVASPVWFANLAGTLYVYTDATTGKVKRIRNSPQVQFAACNFRGVLKGPTIAGTARIVTDQQELARADAAINKKYGGQRRILGLVNKITGLFRRNQPAASIVFLAIIP